MVSHPENGSDSPIGSNRDRGRDTRTGKWAIAHPSFSPAHILFSFFFSFVLPTVKPTEKFSHFFFQNPLVKPQNFFSIKIFQ